MRTKFGNLLLPDIVIINNNVNEIYNIIYVHIMMELFQFTPLNQFLEYKLKKSNFTQAEKMFTEVISPILIIPVIF